MFKEPYQLFFPAGVFIGIVGVVAWVFFGFFQSGVYPAVLHSELMIGGFLFTMALGFLMTAIPRFTGTPSANGFEKGVLFLLVTGLFLAALFGFQRNFYSIFALEIICLGFFGLRRIRRGPFLPPPPFVLVGLGLLFTFAASLYLAFEAGTAPSLTRLSLRPITCGLPHFLILGVGGQLLPAILGTLSPASGAPKIPGTPFAKPAADKKRFSLFVIYGIFLAGTFALEVLVNLTLGCFLRALFISWVLLFHWRLYKLPPRGIILTWGLWISAWLLAVSQWLTALFPAHAVPMAHLFFIGSISLMILFVATRVTLSHGGYGQKLEKNSRILLAVMILILLAALTRAAAPFAKNYFFHLAYAASAWLLAVFLWCGLFLRKIFRRPSV